MPGHRIFAAVYDRLLASSEEAGLTEMRRELLRGARGRTLELGAGTGHNLEHYTDSVSELTLTEPDPHMAKRLRRRLQDAVLPFTAEVADAGAERLPFPDSSFDTVACTLVLCTVPDPRQAATEIARVLKPDGELLVIEHVRGEQGSRQARWQDRLERP
ncbi:MAG: class I SAM-dependent methyltransferase, partial [Solirubrobacterales bacterium]